MQIIYWKLNTSHSVLKNRYNKMLPKNVASFWHVPLTTMQLLHLKFSSKVLQGKLKRVYFINSKRENEREQKRVLSSNNVEVEIFATD